MALPARPREEGTEVRTVAVACGRRPRRANGLEDALKVARRDLVKVPIPERRDERGALALDSFLRAWPMDPAPFGEGRSVVAEPDPALRPGACVGPLGSRAPSRLMPRPRAPLVVDLGGRRLDRTDLLLVEVAGTARSE